MKTFSKSESGKRKAERRQGGMITVLFIALLAIMMILVTVESSALFRLHREVKLLEQQQIKRLNLQTNVVAAASAPTKMERP